MANSYQFDKFPYNDYSERLTKVEMLTVDLTLNCSNSQKIL